MNDYLDPKQPYEKSIEDLEFLMQTELLRATPDDYKKSLLQSMRRINLTAGDRLIRQGDMGNEFYLIQEGSCIVSLEKNSRLHPVARRKVGEIVGELSVITGENRSAHADAESRMTLWRVEKQSLDDICQDCPDLLEFLTEIATERLCSRKITAERSIGNYKISDVVAEGGWSIVYKGAHSFLNLPVAVKMLKHSMALDTDFFAQFQNEAKVIAQLNHENIVKVFDIEHVYRTIFIIMEFLEGTTVKGVLRTELRIPFSRIIRVLGQVSQGLHYAHEQGIVHQDVKPSNLFIMEDDQVKIVDFGLASPIGCCSDEFPGTPYYMAPEQIEGEQVDPRTDIYSLGITAFEMVTGRKPYPEDICEVLKCHVTEPIPDPRTINPDVPEDFVQFIRRCTQKAPAARYQNMAQVIEALGSMATDEAPPESPPTLAKKRRMMSLFMFYEDEQFLELNRLLDNFSRDLKKLGAQLRVADFEDI
ncbi:protein kinase [Thermodesulfobacteriota bacterium]